jgi:hypothetical protein
MQNATVMEENQIFLTPVVGIHEWWSNRGSLHTIQKFPNLLQVGKLRAIGIECPFTRSSFGEWIHDDARHAARVNLEVKTAGNGIFPKLYDEYSVNDSGIGLYVRTIGKILIFASSQGGNSFNGSSNPSLSIPSPVGSACAGAIHT